MHRSRHLTLTSSLSGVSALAATGVRGMRWASGGWNAADTAGPTASRARDADACEGLQASSAPGFIRLPCEPTANPSNARIAIQPVTDRKQLALLVSASPIPADRHS